MLLYNNSQLFLDSENNDLRSVDRKGEIFIEGTHRGLEERHITLMSLGAAIGVGLFLNKEIIYSLNYT